MSIAIYGLCQYSRLQSSEELEGYFIITYILTHLCFFAWLVLYLNYTPAEHDEVSIALCSIGISVPINIFVLAITSTLSVYDSVELSSSMVNYIFIATGWGCFVLLLCIFTIALIADIIITIIKFIGGTCIKMCVGVYGWCVCDNVVNKITPEDDSDA